MKQKFIKISVYFLFFSTKNLEDEEEEVQLTPPEIKESVKNFTEGHIVPKKSSEKYQKWYQNFEKWVIDRTNNTYISESIIIHYFKYLMEEELLAINTIRTKLSGIRTVLLSKGTKIDYERIIQILKLLEKGQTRKKSKIMTRDQVDTWLKNIPDTTTNVAKKVIVLLSLFGALRRSEVCDLTIDQVQIYEDHALINIHSRKQESHRSFILPQKSQFSVSPFELLKKWLEMRKEKSKDRLFLSTNKHGLTNNPIGINKIGTYPSEVAEYLGLEEPKKFTGHCWRRCAATWAVEEGADLLQLKRVGGWTSGTAAEGYLAESRNDKRKLATFIGGQTSNESEKKIKSLHDFEKKNVYVSLNLTNCTIQSIVINKIDE